MSALSRVKDFVGYGIPLNSPLPGIVFSPRFSDWPPCLWLYIPVLRLWVCWCPADTRSWSVRIGRDLSYVSEA
jgi:hypothetical protein